MSITINAKGTSVPFFKIGKTGVTLYQGTDDPSLIYSVEVNDFWFDTVDGSIKVYRGAQDGWETTTASTAYRWATARQLSFTGDVTGSNIVDGSADVSFSLALSSTGVTPGSYTNSNITVDSKGRITAISNGSASGGVSSITAGSGISVSGSTGDVTISTNATSSNTANTIVSRDASGNFSAGTISASLSGNASTATSLQTARTINGVSFDGTSNITVTAPNPNALTIGTGLSGTSYDGSGNVTIAIDSTVATLTGSQTLTNKTVSGGIYSGVVDVTGSSRSSIVAVAALDIDCSLGNFFTKTINSNSTFTFSNAPSGKAYSFVLELTQTTGTVTWPASVRWPASTAPTLTAGKTHLFVFVTDDGGTTWRGVSNVDYTN